MNITKTSASVGNTRLVNLHNVERRNDGVRRKRAGWQKAVQLGIVPERYRKDLDQQATEPSLAASAKLIGNIRTFRGDRKAQITSQRKQLTARGKEISAKRKRSVNSAREHTKKLVESARRERDHILNQVRSEAKKQKDKIRYERSLLHKDENTNRAQHEQLHSIHIELGKYEDELDGIMLAAFPGKSNRTLREAIRNGNIELIDKLKDKDEG